MGDDEKMAAFGKIKIFASTVSPIRTLISTRRALTCLCIPRWDLKKNYDSALHQPFYTSSICNALDKDIKDKRTLLAQKESDLSQPTLEVEVKLEGLLAAGIPTPSKSTHASLIDGVRFDELPIMYIQSTHNNTIMSLTKADGTVITGSSCGVEGFRNAKKGTNIAAQAVGISL